ncbi:MAG: YdeI/OmpD-associated family protein [Anaerolineales bacterium]|nr:YdeI/OmpD-associated family protein [Anaerolineales bacterium]MCW5855777.1 YdeI/OmpD-associated family protein [Anaerolineales bacterium]
MDPIFFASPAEFGDWLWANHAKAREVLVGYYKVGTGKPSLTWEQSVDEALCYGWIDGVRKSLGAESYTIRFTPRKAGSIWSNKNIASAERLISTGRMQPPGLAAYQARRAERSGIYSFEQVETGWGTKLEAEFQAHPTAWEFFNQQPAGYQRTMQHWVTSAKREETQLKRLARLIELSVEGRRVDFMKPFGGA